MRIKSFKRKKLSTLLLGILLIIIIGIIFVLFKINLNNEIEKTAINNDQTMLLGANEVIEENPYIPTGYTQVEGTNLETGFTIQDSLGNQYVWVEVPRTIEVYTTAGLDITEFSDSDYTKIENDLHTYTNVYRDNTSYTDTYYSDATTGLTETEYYELKQNMLKSIYKYEGFYIGKYETGIEDAPRTSGSETEAPTEIPVIKQNAYPYGSVTCSQAQTLASGFASELEGYTSSLMFGVQWDLILKYLETKGATQEELNVDSTNWGNYVNNLWDITNTSSKYSTDLEDSWTSGAYGKKASDDIGILLSTGASDTFSKQGIYDLAGNVDEYTLEYTSDETYPCAIRSGDYSNNGYDFPANSRSSTLEDACDEWFGFHVALYKVTEQEHGPSDIIQEYNKTETGHTPVYTCTYPECTETYEGIEEPHNNETYVDNGDGTHSSTCTKCGAVTTENHNYENGECKDCKSQEPEINIDTGKYEMFEAYITQIQPKTIVNTVKNNITTNATEINIYNHDNELLKDADIIGTGMKLELKKENQIKKFTLIVRGDVDGDGASGMTDILKINQYRLSKKNLEKVYLNAGEVTGDEKVDFADIIKINRFRLNKITEL